MSAISYTLTSKAHRNHNSLYSLHNRPDALAKRLSAYVVAQLSKGQKLSTFSFPQSYFITFLDKHLPSFLEIRLVELKKLVTQPIFFPKKLIEEMVTLLIGIYAQVDNAAAIVTQQPYNCATIDRCIEQVLHELAEKTGATQDLLLPLGTEKLFNDVIFVKIFEKLPFYLIPFFYIPLKILGWLLSTFSPFFVRKLAAYLPKESPKDPITQRLLKALEVLVIEVVVDLQKKLEQQWKNPSKKPLELDRNLFKELLQKQIKILQLQECSSHEELRSFYQPGNLKDFASWFQNRYVLDEICRVIEEILSVAWDMIQSPLWRKEKIDHLYTLMYEALVENKKNAKSSIDVENVINSLTTAIIEHEIKGRLKTTETTLDRGLGFFFDWASTKERITRCFKAKFHASIPETSLTYIVPLALEGSAMARKVVGEFWKKPYIQNHALLQLLKRLSD